MAESLGSGIFRQGSIQLLTCVEVALTKHCRADNAIWSFD